ncbi:MAG: LON peptidase substrate-binding domain-containing protein [Alphaproteobacteria bacterium]|nr:LON peptidase substrate-binding domain-containing protein [Alphaproteobacteria bacterium]
MIEEILDIKQIPIFPLSNCILLPNGALTLNIFEPRYLNMTEDAISNNRLIGMIQPKSNSKDKIDLYSIGCVGKIIHFSELKDQKYLIELKGICRYQLINHELTNKDYRVANIDFKKYALDLASVTFNLDRLLKEDFLNSLKIYFTSQKIDADWKVIEKAPINLLINSLAQSCPFSIGEKQILLESKDLNDLANILITLFKIYSAGETKDLN